MSKKTNQELLAQYGSLDLEGTLRGALFRLSQDAYKPPEGPGRFKMPHRSTYDSGTLDRAITELMVRRTETAQLEQHVQELLDQFKPEQERLQEEVTRISGELEVAKVQRTLLSGAMQQNTALEQQLREAREVQAGMREEINALRDHDLHAALRQKEEAKQQLAEVREALRIALAQRQNYRAHLTQARALLEEMPEPVYTSENDYWCCTCCAAVYPHRLRRGPFRHEDTCPWRKVRAFLASLDTETPPA